MNKVKGLVIALAIVAAPLRAHSEEHSDATQDGTLQEEESKDILLDESIEALLPVDEDGIRRFKNKRDRIDAALEASPAQMRTQTRQLNVTPGSIPQVVRLTAGYVSTIVFQDSTGAPWPILSSTVGAADAFSVTQPKVEQDIISEAQAANSSSAIQAKNMAKLNEQIANVQSNILNIVPLTKHASSNLAISLEGAPYPIQLHLLTESKDKEARVTDSLVVFRLDKQGPHAAMPQLTPTTPTTITPELLGMLHGIPPQGAILLKTEPRITGVTVWEYNNKFFLRTRYAAVFPAWLGVANSEDMRVYVIPKTPSLVLSINGTRQKFIVTGEK